MDANWEDEALFFDGEPFFADLFRAIEKAVSTIEFETYIFTPENLGRQVEAALAAAAKRGVKVRLLVDGIGAAGWYEKKSPELERSGVVVRIYHPVVVSRILGKFFSELGFGRKGDRRGPALAQLNRRDHRKMCLIDGRIAYVGSMNVSDNHLSSVRGHLAWRDTGVRVMGEPVTYLQVAFDHAWLRSHAAGGKRRWRDLLHLPEKPRLTSHLVRLNFTQRLRRRTIVDFLKRVKASQGKIWITNAYLAPSSPVMRALSAAASRGVDVRLLVPRTSDVFFMPWVATAHYGPLLKSGVRIFEYLPRFLHAKSAIIDGWAVVGTSNMNRRSLLYDFEVDIVLSRAESVRELEAQFGRDLETAEEIKVRRGGVAGLLGRFILYWFKRWI